MLDVVISICSNLLECKLHGKTESNLLLQYFQNKTEISFILYIKENLIIWLSRGFFCVCGKKYIDIYY